MYGCAAGQGPNYQSFQASAALGTKISCEESPLTTIKRRPKNENDDIIETATKAGNFQVFTKALSDAGLKQALKDDGPFTIFAPTDEAFAKLTAGKLDNLLKPENRDKLQLLLRNHIVPGKLMSTELKNLDTTKTAPGEDLKIESRAGLWINEARVVSPDLEASNGVLHGINTVLLPQANVATAG